MAKVIVLLEDHSHYTAACEMIRREGFDRLVVEITQSMDTVTAMSGRASGRVVALIPPVARKYVPSEHRAWNRSKPRHETVMAPDIIKDIVAANPSAKVFLLANGGEIPSQAEGRVPVDRQMADLATLIRTVIRDGYNPALIARAAPNVVLNESLV